MGILEVVLKQEREEGYREGLALAKAEIEAEKLVEKLKFAKEFKSKGVAIEVIAKALGLTLKQVENLK